jgi:hypothetical protein
LPILASLRFLLCFYPSLHRELCGALFSVQFGGVFAQLQLWSTLQPSSFDRQVSLLAMIELVFLFKSTVGVLQVALFRAIRNSSFIFATEWKLQFLCGSAWIRLLLHSS